MFYSIRWQLIGSYILLTVLAVSLVGFLALSFIQRHTEQQEIDYLTANAEALARRAWPLLWPVRRERELFNLVHTASFLSNVRVRILDARQQPIIDSGPQPGIQQFALVAPAAERAEVAVGTQAVQLMILPDMGAAAPPHHWRWPRAGDAVTVVSRIDSPWGSRLYFEEKEAVLELSAPLSTTQTPPEFGLSFRPSEIASPEETPTRSDRTIMVPIGDEDRPLGYIELSNSPNFGAEALTTARQAFLLAAGGASLVALLVGLLVSRGLTIPLQQLIGAANRMSSGDLSVRAPVRGHAEITELGLQFNQMAERLEASFSELAQERDALRRFIADASHELRTPVAALRNFNELLQGPASHDPAARAEFLSESQNQIKRLEWLIDNLLNLSRLEAGLVALNLADQDVGEMISTLQASFNLLAQEKEIELQVKYPVQPLLVRCDRARFESVLSNLLDNALKFAPAGGRVELGAQQVDQAVQFWVKDNGPGIAPADQARIFERFYRGQNARTIGGSGLGLAIAQRMVQAHGGRIFVASDLDNSSCFIVELPL